MTTKRASVDRHPAGRQAGRRVRVRHRGAVPAFDDLDIRLAAQLRTLPDKAPMAAAIRTALARTAQLGP